MRLRHVVLGPGTEGNLRAVQRAEAGGGFDRLAIRKRWTQTEEGGLSGGFTNSWEKEQTALMPFALRRAKKSVFQSRKARFSTGVCVGSMTHFTPYVPPRRSPVTVAWPDPVFEAGSSV